MKASDINETNPTVSVPNMSDETLVTLFRRAVRIMARSHHQHGHAHHAQKHILGILGEREPMSQRDLLEMLDVRSASLSELLAKLERGGLIARERDMEDKRSSVITLTDQGRTEARAIGDERRENAANLFSALTGAEKQQLGELLARLIVSLEETFSDHGHHHCHGRRHHGHGGGEERPMRSRHEHGFHGHREGDCEGHGGRHGHGGRCGRHGRPEEGDEQE